MKRQPQTYSIDGGAPATLRQIIRDNGIKNLIPTDVRALLSLGKGESTYIGIAEVRRIN